METELESMCKKVRGRLIDDHYPFYAVNAWKLTHLESTTIQTAATDGTRIWINPSYFKGLHPEERLFLYAHEIAHDVFQHPYRCGGRDMELWNIACDYVVNDALMEDKIGKPPKGVLVCPPQFKGKSAEHIYAVLDKDRRDKPPEPDKGKDTEDVSGEDKGDGPKEYLKDCPTGSFCEAPGPESETFEETDMTPGDWDVSVEEALMAQAKEGGDRGGNSAPNTDRAIAESRKANTNWIARLWQFVEKTIPSGKTWSKPNRRYMAHGLYLPSVAKSNMPKLGMGVDTSGSISTEWLQAVQYALTEINTQLRPREIEVVYCNSEFQGHETFTPDMEVELHPKGGGGTCDMDFWPIITDWFNLKEGDDKPAAVLVYTDLGGKVPPEPDYPVMWVVPEWSSYPDPPYGETIRVSLFS